MKKHAGALAALFMTMAAGAAQAGETPACSSDNARVPTIEELSRQPAPAAGQALAIIVALEEDSALWARLRAAPAESYGALLNDVAPDSIVFDPDTARKLADVAPIVLVYGCVRGGAGLTGALDDLKTVPGIVAAAPDTLLFPMSVLPGGGTTPPPPRP